MFPGSENERPVRRISQIALLLVCGVVAASQIGKAIISIPLIRSDMGLGYGFAGLIVATFATIGASVGIGAGAFVQQMGTGRALLGGMSVIASGNIIGALAPNEAVLLGARIVEGLGFFGAVLAIPSVLSGIAGPRDRDFIMAIWSAYMPAGITVMLVLGPLVPLIGWRPLWLASAAVAGICAVLVALFGPCVSEAKPTANDKFYTEAAKVLQDRSCWTLAFCFFLYSCQIFSMSFALPLLLTSAYGVTLGTAGLISAAILAVSTIGHISSAFSLRAGVPVWANIAAAFAFFAVSGFAVYNGVHNPAIVAIIAALALGIGGLAPGALYAAAPQVAPTQRAVPATIGLLQQASNLGQFAGPVVLGAWVEHFGWQMAPEVLVPAALLGLAGSFIVRRELSLRGAALSTVRTAQVKTD
jgi:MFS transporter, DHA1 family, inner membrane transport protein